MPFEKKYTIQANEKTGHIYITISTFIAQELDLKKGDTVKQYIKDGKIIIEPVQRG